MRIAVCLSGQPRAIEICVESLRENLLGGRECDFFVHFWSSSRLERISWEDYRKETSLYMRLFRGRKLRDRYDRHMDFTEKREATYKQESQAIAREAEAAYPSCRLVIEEQKSFCVAQFRKESQIVSKYPIKNTLSMYYSIKRANDLKREREEAEGFTYDVVVRCRPDLFFFSAFPLEPFLGVAKTCIVLPNRGFPHGAVNDQLAVGSSRIMDIYAATFDSIPEHYERGGLVHPETILRSHLEKSSVPLCFAPFDYEIVRGEWKDADDFKKNAARVSMSLGPGTDRKLQR